MNQKERKTPTLDPETLSTCVRQLEDVFVKLRHPQGSYVPPFVLKKLQHVLLYLEDMEKAEKYRKHGTFSFLRKPKLRPEDGIPL